MNVRLHDDPRSPRQAATRSRLTALLWLTGRRWSSPAEGPVRAGSRAARRALRVSLAGFSLAVAGLLAGCGGHSTPKQQPSPGVSNASSSAVNVPLEEQNGSGQAGQATLQPSGHGMRVLITLRNDRASSNPAHIHDVTCAQYRRITSVDEQYATVKNPLSDLRAGRSETTLGDVSPSDRTTGTYSINVHEPTYPYKAVACGDIPRR
jgi:hypothetical protein